MPNAVGIQFSLDSYPRFYKPTVEGLAPRDFCVVPDPHGGEPRSHYVRLHCELVTGRRLAPSRPVSSVPGRSS